MRLNYIKNKMYFQYHKRKTKSNEEVALYYYQNYNKFYPMYMNVVTKVDPGPYQNFLILLVLLIVILVLVIIVVRFRQIFLVIQLGKQCVCPTAIQKIYKKIK